MASIADVNAKIQSVTDTFRSEMVTTGRNAWRNATTIIKSMDEEDGRLVGSIDNQTRIDSLGLTLFSAFTTQAYQGRVQKVINSLTPIRTLIEQTYEDQLGPIPDPSPLDGIQERTESAIRTLTALDVVQSIVIDPAVMRVSDAVSSRAQKESLINNTEQFITSAMELFATQRVGTQLEVYARDIGRVYQDSFQLVWAQYVGGLIPTSREFCIARSGRFYHLQEIADWADLDWAEKIPGTNRTSIFSMLGGWNCRHQLQYVTADRVPQSDKDRARAAGLI